VPVSYVAGRDLIEMRLAVGRPKDLRRAAELGVLLGGSARTEAHT
jgi:hypothetical protein